MTLKRTKIVKKIGIVVLAIGVVLALVGYRMWTKPHRDITVGKASPTTGIQLVTDFEKDEVTANQKYLDKIVEVSGEVTELTSNQQGNAVVVIKGTDFSSVRCTLEQRAQFDIAIGSTVLVRGICTGYLNDVILVRCVVLK